MLILLSPAKTLDMQTPSRTAKTTRPGFPDETGKLVRSLQRHSRKRLGELMHLSDSLARLNVARYRELAASPSDEAARPAIQAFRGDVYQGLDADTLSMADIHYAQNHLRILSGLYGVLRPLDRIHAHRLEMGTRLKTRRGQTLYDFWGDRLTEHLNADLAASGDDLVVNLASAEYFRSVRPAQLDGALVSPVFKDETADGFRVVGIHAKKARGAMARHLIDARVSELEGIQAFDGLGYRFDRQQSTHEQPVFTRAASAVA